jgi:hypothetical protein
MTNTRRGRNCWTRRDVLKAGAAAATGYGLTPWRAMADVPLEHDFGQDQEAAMKEVTHRTIETNGIRLHIAEQGDGPLVVLCHGFPESWYSWRHQLTALAEAGFRAVAPDMLNSSDLSHRC